MVDFVKVGNVLRKVVLDGWPVENAIALDLESSKVIPRSRSLFLDLKHPATALWHYGHELFKSTPESFPAGFVGGDVFDPNIIQPREPFYEPPATPRPQNLQLLKSLIPLQGHVSAIHTSSFFHLFDRETQAELAKRLASLLSPEPGSVIFGGHRGLPAVAGVASIMGYAMWCDSPESCRDLWDGQVFKKGTVRVDAIIEETNRTDVSDDEGNNLYWLDWSVTRL
jgi:hypothetical protein